MSRYYFDMREGDKIIPDVEGLEFRTMEAVQEEAAGALADMARDKIRLGRKEDTRMSIQVRDDAGQVMQVRFVFEIDRQRPE